MGNGNFISLQDQTGYRVMVKVPIKRIISLVPSQTELLYDLGLEDKIVGRTKFCIHPKEKSGMAIVVGGTKNYRLPAIVKLRPDLILANKEENDRESIEKLRQEFPVWTSDIATLAHAYQMIEAVGKLCDCKSAAETLVWQIREKFSRLPRRPLRKALYLIWRNPYISVGRDTFIHHMMMKAGFGNCLTKENRYPELTEERIKTLEPEVILLSSEPYPFKQTHVNELKILCPKAKIYLVNGEMFSWYGSRLLKVPDYFAELAE